MRELRKRTRTATAKVLENKSIEAETSSPRKTRKPRRTAPALPDEVNDFVSGGQIEGDMGHDKVIISKIGNAGVNGSVISNSTAEGNKDEKGKANEENWSTADVQVHEDENISKKRRKVGVVSHEAETTEDAVIDNHGKKNIQGGKGSTNLYSSDDQSQPQLPPGESNAGGFTSGVELPIQLNKRKDIHTGSGVENGSVTLPPELTPKRPRRSSSEEGKTNDIDDKHDSPTKRVADGKGKEIRASSGKSEEAAAPLGTSSRRRTRITYKELSDEEEEYDHSSIPNPSPPKGSVSGASRRGKAGANKKQGAVEQPTPKARKGRKGVWDKEVLLTSKKSRLATAADLSDVLNFATWDLLSPEEQKECLALLPTIDKVYNSLDSSDPNGDLNGEANLAPDFFESNQVFKDALVEFQDDLSQGRYEPSYITEAAYARKARLEGATDKYKDGQYELFWGQRQQFGMVAGAAANIKLPELIQKGLLKAGDIWAYKRTFRGITTIEKQVSVAEVTNENGKYSLVFHIPPGKNKVPKSSCDIVLEGVVAPGRVEDAILNTHPDTPHPVPNGNAFKVFNIWRKGEDLGLLWEIRQTYWGGE